MCSDAKTVTKIVYYNLEEVNHFYKLSNVVKVDPSFLLIDMVYRPVGAESVNLNKIANVLFIVDKVEVSLSVITQYILKALLF